MKASWPAFCIFSQSAIDGASWRNPWAGLRGRQIRGRNWWALRGNESGFIHRNIARPGAGELGGVKVKAKRCNSRLKPGIFRLDAGAEPDSQGFAFGRLRADGGSAIR